MKFQFEPSGTRANALDRAMHVSLAQSLHYISQQCLGQIDFDAVSLNRLVENISVTRYGATLFGLYYQLVDAIDDDDHTQAGHLFDRLVSEQPVSSGLQVHAIEDEWTSGQAELYRRGMSTDPTVNFSFLQPPDEMAAQFKQKLVATLDRFEPVLPEMIAEIRGLLSEIVLAVGEADAEYVFDGGSSYQLWGALFLNPAFHDTEIQVMEVVAHEAAHTLLFGLTVEEALTENDDDELYASPLRVDPRPMEGIYHATFVSARMHWALSKLLASEVLTEKERDFALAAQSEDAANFFAGLSVVEEHGRLTPTGSGIMQAAKQYMTSVINRSTGVST
ncbi:aKG-HExxH-type peptide beta-hydroxylase [Devosia aurantiaca]|uniref:HEXXH motif domain-containing protein n=1 Tax=Devosia aurantiaca TaxID=2714858 RepID=A0A6M1SGG0_9HYPH|nr:HEXXH motif-containing putative peptide modification protein [Devosia aurantiaca]NGP18557.1 HEXXH motif domain-containing protein [Devosia aurantiaca]